MVEDLVSVCMLVWVGVGVMMLVCEVGAGGGGWGERVRVPPVRRARDDTAATRTALKRHVAA